MSLSALYVNMSVSVIECHYDGLIVSVLVHM